MNREKKIIQTSVIGILVNLSLAILKAAIGLLSNSIDFILDAINNLSDTLSSLITIIGTKLSLKAPDEKHPLGYGRIEYLTSLIVAAFVLYAGVESLIESIKSIIDPKEPTYTTWGLVLITVTIFAKMALGFWTEKKGEQLESNALIASGKDSRMDSLVTLSTVVSALLFIFFKIHLSGWLGLAISVLIIKSGVEILNDSVSKILGERAPHSLSKEIIATIAAVPDVKGVYDLVLSNYGPHTLIGSVHIEVNDTMSMNELDTLERKIANLIYEKYQIYLTGIGIYTKNTENTFVQTMQNQIRALIEKDPLIKHMHGFYIDPSHKRIQFDVVLDFKEKDANKKRSAIIKQVKTLFPDYYISVTVDREISG